MGLPETVEFARKFAVMVRVQGPDPKGLKMRNHAFHLYNSGKTTLSASGMLVPNTLLDVSFGGMGDNDALVVTIASVAESFLSAKHRQGIYEGQPELIPGATIDIMIEDNSMENNHDNPEELPHRWIPANLLALIDLPLSSHAVQSLIDASSGSAQSGWEYGWSLALDDNASQTVADAVKMKVGKLRTGRVESNKPESQVIIPSAAFAGVIISFVLCPSELVKCRMQVQGTDSLVPKSSRYLSPLDCALKTIRKDGVTGIFRGGFTTFLREFIGNAVFFTVYENVRYHMHLQVQGASADHSNLIDVGIGIMGGGLGGVAFWSAVLPLDVAKTVIQTAPERGSTNNPFQILKLIYRRGGLKGCYAGLGPTIVRAFPANAAAIVTLELAVKFLGIKRG